MQWWLLSGVGKKPSNLIMLLLTVVVVHGEVDASSAEDSVQSKLVKEYTHWQFQLPYLLVHVCDI